MSRDRHLDWGQYGEEKNCRRNNLSDRINRIHGTEKTDHMRMDVDGLIRWRFEWGKINLKRMVGVGRFCHLASYQATPLLALPLRWGMSRAIGGLSSLRAE